MRTPPTEDDGSLLEEDRHPLEEGRQVPYLQEHNHLPQDRVAVAQQDTQGKQLVGQGVRSSAW